MNHSSIGKTLYHLVMFPYPSGATMHVGHASNYIPNDVLVRRHKMNDHKVINPIGRDSFGLPTENFAIKEGRSAHEVTKENIVKFKEQLHKMDMDYDRDREFATSDPEYYKWTQRVFLKLFKAGLVYRKEALVNRCPVDQTVIANDQVVEGRCERCGTEIIQKKHPQRFIKITDYAERLLSDLDLVDRPEETKAMQRNWIGKSEGAEIVFTIANVQNIQKDQIISKQFNGQEYDDQTSSIIGEAIEIHKKYKDTITEKQFRDILEQKLIKKGHRVEKEKKISIQEEGVYIGSRFIDLVVDGDILLELKKVALQKDKDKGIRQLRNYLDLQQKGCGLFLNIATDVLEIKRLNYLDKQELTNSSNAPDLNNSEHSEISYITVFTTRPDTIYGVTAVMLAPEVTDYDDLIAPEYKEAVMEYRKTTALKTAVERQQNEKDKSGVFSGFFVVHPLTNEQIPVRYADYVLASYGTGAVMFVPAHDERDREFYHKRMLPLLNSTPLPASPSRGGERLDSDVIDLVALRQYKQTPEYVVELAKEMRTNQTKAEQVFWEIVRRNNLFGTHWRRQHPFGRYIADFYCHALQLVVEIDGATHHEGTAEYDKIREEAIELYGVSILRFTNEEIYNNIEGVYDRLVQYIRDSSPLLEGEGLGERGIRGEGWGEENIGGESSREHGILPLRPVISSTDHDYSTGAYTGAGTLINSVAFDGLSSEEAKKTITSHLASLKLGQAKTTYRLRDRSVSRQRYRGSPIPIYYDETGTPQPIPESELPVVLPLDVANYKPAGKSPLEDHPTFKYYNPRKSLITNIHTIPDMVGEIKFPLLIHGKEKMGSSHYTVMLTKKLHSLGKKIIFFSKHQAAKDSLLENISSDYKLIQDFDITGSHKESLLIITSGEQEDLVKFLKQNEVSDYILVIKNCDVFDPEQILQHFNGTQYIISGDASGINLGTRTFGSAILFSDYKEHTIGNIEQYNAIVVYNVSGKVPYYTCTESELQLKSDVPTVARRNVSCIVKHPTEEKFLFVRRKDSGKLAFCVGGIEEGDDAQSTALKELHEETGYKNARVVKLIGQEFHSQYYVAHKNVNRYVVAQCVYLELIDEQRDDVDEKEAALHDTVWLARDEVEAHLSGFGINQYVRQVFCGTAPALPLIDRINEHTKDLLANHPAPTYLRECDTLDTFMCSSFYFLRFVDPHNPDQLARRELLDATMPVDFYIGGKEHTVGHLLYSRFIHKFLYDQGFVGCPEPFQRLIHQGMVLAHDGRKMSKRRGNVITPDQIIDEYGSDTLRLYEMFMGPLEAEKRRDDNSVKGVHRFVERIKKLTEKVRNEIPSLIYPATHVMIKGITEDIEQLKFNTAVSKMMIYINEISALETVNTSDFLAFLKTISPFATKISQELWTQLGQSGLIKQQSRPSYDPAMIKTQTINLPVQINGKMRGNLDVATGLTQDEVMALIRSDEKLSKYLEGTIKKVIFVQDKIVNVIV